MPGKHLILSPSGAKRWLQCPGSLFAPQGDSGGADADRGTAMHHLFEFLLLQHLPPESRTARKGFVTQLLAPWGDTPVLQWIAAHPDAAELMPLLTYAAGKSLDEEDVLQVVHAVDTIRQIIWDHRLSNTYMCLEMENVLQAVGVDETRGDYWCGGTADCVLIGERDGRSVLVVCDLKTGRSPVAPSDPQLLLYAAMVLELIGNSPFGRPLASDGVITVVIQQRANPPVSFHSCSPDEIGNLVDNVKRVRDALIGHNLSSQSPPESLLKAGTHCQYCRRRAVCSAYSEDQRRNMSVAVWEAPGGRVLPTPVSDMKMGDLLSLDQLGPVVLQFLKDVKTELLRRAHKGEKVPGKKLVASFGHREWYFDKRIRGRELVSAVAHALMLPEEVVVDIDVATPAEVERRLVVHGVKPAQAKHEIGKLTTTRVRGVKLCDVGASGDEIQPEAVQMFLKAIEEHENDGNDD